jgi:hypothetical protein
LKEILALGILATALSAVHRGEEHLDGLDKALLTYVGITTLYVLGPHIFTSFSVTHNWSARLLSWRADCGYVLLFLGVRHAPLPPRTRRTLTNVVFIMGTLTVLVAIYQWARPDQWANFVLKTGHQTQYQVSVLHNDAAVTARNLAYLTDHHPLRVGSIQLSPFDMADYLLLSFALAIERIARHERSRWTYLLCGGVLAALFASRVRADSLAAVIITIVALLPAPKRPTTARLRLIGAVCAAGVIVIPSLGGSRFTNGQGGAASNQGHIREVQHGLSELWHYPLGEGIGNVAGVGDKFVLSGGGQGAFTTDNSVLQVSGELGIQALIPWLIMLGLAWRALGRAARQGDAFAGGVRLALLGIVVAGMYHHVFLNFALPWTLWATAGLALKWPNQEAAETGIKVGSTITAPGVNMGMT